ncbi:iron permease [Auriscalpium vulgare]|uniref:Iron permease n=1 Tax=Auriscalpium vulgare TaxID=40419 RepID=A0ACB8RT04_9AGAM|nr:iron permease [Auriscalpium vulgare]
MIAASLWEAWRVHLRLHSEVHKHSLFCPSLVLPPVLRQPLLSVTSFVVMEKSPYTSQPELKFDTGVAPTSAGTAVVPKRGFDFWLVFVANLTVDLLSALDLTAVPTALPTIVQHLHGTDFIWAGGAYTVASTAVLPLVGGLVSVFGRKPVLLTFIFLFASGSDVSGAAQSMAMLIGGRALQGVGGGGCLAVTEIIYADLVPLPERGKFQGITASVWALACAVGPPVGGALANTGAWRWLFFLNLPICAIAAGLVVVFLRVNAPKTTWKEKVRRMDWLGNALIIGSTISLMIAFIWGGVRFPWRSAHILVPLTVGSVGILVFFIVEALPWLKEPTVPRFAFTSRTTLSGYLGTFFHGIVSLTAIYYLPVYFQACMGASAVGSGVDMFGLSFTVPAFAIACGLSVQIVDRYRPQNYVRWVLIVIGFGVLSLLDENSSRSQYIGYQIPVAAGLGIVWISTQFSILAPLPFSNNAHALAFFTFVRCFAQGWGVAIGGIILQNSLHRRLPSSFLSSFPEGVSIVYAVIPAIGQLAEPERSQVRAAFSASLKLTWRVMLGFSGAGLLTTVLMREEKLRKVLDDTWGLKENNVRDKDEAARV